MIKLEEQLLKGGFQHVSYMGKCGHRHVFIARTSALPVNSSPVRNISPTGERVLTEKQRARLAGYIQAFLAAPEHFSIFRSQC